MLSYSRWFAFCVLFFALATPAMASVTVEGMTLVSKKRVGRTSFAYTYRIMVNNDSAVDIEEVAAYLTTTGTGTTIIDDTAMIGTVAKGTSVLSTDTITIRQNRRYRLDLDLLKWEVGFNALITISGIVTDAPIGNAVVVGTVSRIESGRPVVESGRPVVEAFSVPAEPDGTYTLNMVGVSDDDFVDLNATGVGSQSDVELSSNVGSVGTILEDATEGSILVGSGDLSALRVTHVTTALNVLAEKQNSNEPFTNDEDLAAAQANVDNQELISAAALIKVVVDNASIGLPPGVHTTKEMIENESVFESFLEQVQEENPEEYQQAITETIEELSLAYDPAEVPGFRYLALVRINPLVSGANFYEFDANGNGTNIDFNGESDTAWSIDGGDLVIDRLNPVPREFFLFRDDPPGSGNNILVRALLSDIQHRIVRLIIGINSDQVLLGITSQITFPDNPAIPTETTVNPPAPEFAYLSFGEEGIVPYQASELAGQDIAFEHYHQDNNTVATLNPAFAADVMTFNADGSGITRRREFGFTWSIDALGRLDIVFDNGDTNSNARYSAGLPDPSVLVGHFGNSAGATDGLSIPQTDGLVFNNANVVNQKYRSAFFIVTPDPEGTSGIPRFDFTFLPDGTGCRDSGLIRDLTWDFNSVGHLLMDLTFFDGNTNVVFQERDWQLLTVVPGDIGPQFWLIETFNVQGPFGQRADPPVIAGRMNYYENIGDVTGNTPPTANPDAVATDLDTPVTVDILANDVDSEGDPIIITGWTGGTMGGTVSGVTSPSGAVFISLMYTPPLGFTGVDTFTYTIADGSCSAPDTGNVTINVN